MATRKVKINISSFFVGLAVGLSLFWLPLNSEYSSVSFATNKFQDPLKSATLPSYFIPITAPLIHRKNYILAYDGRTRNPHWVYHKLTSNSQQPLKALERSSCDFKEDPLLPEHIRAKKSDYLASGWDRGHLFPAGDSKNQEELEESFFLSNIVPQAPAFNRGYWKKIENHARSLSQHYSTVHAFLGPLYLKKKAKDGKQYVKYQVIGETGIAVPTHFFALFFLEQPSKKILTSAYIIPNRNLDGSIPLKKFSVSVQEVERASGVLFTQMLHHERASRST